jgi:hypothetical protein
MNSNWLYKLITENNGSVIEFKDHSEFFGSWSIEFELKQQRIIFEHDGRDSYLYMIERTNDNKLIELDRVESHALSQEATINQCAHWIVSLK